MNPSLSRERLAQSDQWYFQARKWPICRVVIEKAQARRIPFAVGGSFASLAFSGAPEEPGDIDIFIQAADRERMIQITTEAGMRDYYERKPYDRGWIYRATKDDAIVDVIWAMANRRTEVDGAWLDRGPEIGVDGVRFRLIPVEELLWTKLYIIQRDRCDWPDALNLLYTCGRDLDWRHLLARVGDDRALLGALLLFSWICPDRAGNLPAWLWPELGVSPPKPDSKDELCSLRADLLDTRPWFVPTVATKQGA